MEEAEKVLRKVLTIDPRHLLAKDRLENMSASLLGNFTMLRSYFGKNHNKLNTFIKRKIYNPTLPF